MHKKITLFLFVAFSVVSLHVSDPGLQLPPNLELKYSSTEPIAQHQSHATRRKKQNITCCKCCFCCQKCLMCCACCGFFVVMADFLIDKCCPKSEDVQ